jgi:thioredoxin 1
MTDERIIEITSRAQFEEIVQTGLVLVDFYTDGCPPCKVVAKIFPSLVAMFPGLTIAKINESDNEDLVEDFDVDEVGYPNLMIFRDGRCIDTDVPFGSKADLIVAIKEAIEDEGRM